MLSKSPNQMDLLLQQQAVLIVVSTPSMSLITKYILESFRVYNEQTLCVLSVTIAIDLCFIRHEMLNKVLPKLTLNVNSYHAVEWYLSQLKLWYQLQYIQYSYSLNSSVSPGSDLQIMVLQSSSSDKQVVDVGIRLSGFLVPPLIKMYSSSPHVANLQFSISACMQ